MQLEDFYRRALQRLGILASGETASAEDRALVVETYESVYEEINARVGTRAYWSVGGDVPDELALPLATIVAYQLTDEFEVPAEKAMKLRMDSEDGSDAAWAKVISLTARSQPVLKLDNY
jgi:hypothetical protein